jgi:hypothetical protein
MNKPNELPIRNLNALKEERQRLHGILAHSKEGISEALSPPKLLDLGLQSLPFFASQIMTPTLLAKLMGKKSYKKKLMGLLLSLVLPKLIERGIAFFKKRS